jgi:phosphoribosylformylglycinamidine (FGAM) synthase PurS component
MKKFLTKILIKSKPTAQNVKCLNLKLAIEKIVPVRDLTCQTGMFYMLNFSAQDQREALHMVDRVAKNLLSNEVVEDYEIKALEEVYD